MHEEALKPDIPPEGDRLERVAHMAEQLADQLLREQILGQPASERRIRALIAASSLLKEYGRDTPPLLSQIMDQDHQNVAPESPEAQHAAEMEDVGRLAWSLRPFQGREEPRN